MEEKLDKVQVVILCIIIAFFIMLSTSVSAQTNHVVDTTKYTYLDLDYRVVKPGFFYEKTLGWKKWFIAYDGVIFRKVWINTIK